MYAFAQRPDCSVSDEPLYASYLALTGHARPYRDLVLAAQETDASRVMQRLLTGSNTEAAAAGGRPVVFAKHMAKHKVGVANDALFQCPGGAGNGVGGTASGGTGSTGSENDTNDGAGGGTTAVRHLLLVREPAAVMQSFARVLAPTQQELGYTALLELASELSSRGQPVHVVLSDALVRQPEPMLRSICHALGLPFDLAMLSWPAGPKPYDGVWAPWWYANTHKGTSFAAGLQEPREALPPHLRPLLGECQALFRLLKRHALAPIYSAADAPSRALTSGAPDPGLEPATTIASSASASSSASHSLQVPTAATAAAAAVAVTAAAATAAAGVTDGAAPVPALPSPPQPPQPPHHSGHHQAHAHGKTGTHVYEQDPRNQDVLVLIRDGTDGSVTLAWRPEARVSVLDSGYMLGDGVWEGIRLHRGTLMFAEAHLARLYEGAKAIDMAMDLSPQQMQELLYSAVDANGMESDVHIRLMVTRGLKPTPYQSPYITIGHPTIVVVPEYKRAAAGPKKEGIRLFTCHIRRGAADVQDPMWNSHSKLNCIAACIQAKQAGVDEALMLDPHGFVATCNSVNFFCVRRGEVWAPTTKYQLHGITRANILRLCRENGIPARELDFSLTQVYSADEAFVTGTFAGVIPVRSVDGRVVGRGTLGPVSARLQQLYMRLMESYAAVGRRDFGDRGPTELEGGIAEQGSSQP